MNPHPDATFPSNDAVECSGIAELFSDLADNPIELPTSPDAMQPEVLADPTPLPLSQKKRSKSLTPTATSSTYDMLKRRPRERDISRRRKVAYLLGQDVRRIQEDLKLRQALLVDVWSSMRLRQPILSVLRTRYEGLRPDDILLLPIDCITYLEQFYRKVDEFRLYIQTTEDMPTTLETTYEGYLRFLETIGQPLLWHLDNTHYHDEAAQVVSFSGGEIADDA